MKLYSVGLWLGFAALVLSGCSSGVESQFIRGCKATGGESSLCSCLYDKMENKYGEKGMDKNLNDYPTEAFQEDLMDKTVQCMKES